MLMPSLSLRHANAQSQQLCSVGKCKCYIPYADLLPRPDGMS
ncbi:hypothetical protein BFJ68_g12099 [Fusarium oxysporum]|uniref:Uncharacterized protein n=2 Tax=Fusarium oxysporum TaxID=5507 RepID=A0A420QAS6_FUSOX|nr:hypothetical protein BFJ65_g5612 [Fusarium oxysporum f. sp. cepae]RKL01864.1 hypothetical protein BFJ68_g12099 [Fusarium oxysporum]